MRYWINDIKAVKINSKECVLELKNFVRQANGTWSAKPGKLDDRVMALVWALNMLDTLCCQGFFNIDEYDMYGKPKAITPYYQPYGSSEEIRNPINEASNLEIDGKYTQDMPILGRVSDLPEVQKLKQQGWTPFVKRSEQAAKSEENIFTPFNPFI